MRKLGIMKTVFLYLTLAAFLSACGKSPQSKASSLNSCKQTVLDYADLRDDPGKAEAYGDLFTQTGTFTLGPNTITGRNALIARHKAANGLAAWHHTMENIHIAEDNQTGLSRVIVYTTPKDDNEVVTRMIVAEYIDKFQIIDGKCKITDRQVRVIHDSIAG